MPRETKCFIKIKKLDVKIVFRDDRQMTEIFVSAAEVFSDVEMTESLLSGRLRCNILYGFCVEYSVLLSLGRTNISCFLSFSLMLMEPH